MSDNFTDSFLKGFQVSHTIANDARVAQAQQQQQIIQMMQMKRQQEAAQVQNALHQMQMYKLAKELTEVPTKEAGGTIFERRDGNWTPVATAPEKTKTPQTLEAMLVDEVRQGKRTLTEAYEEKRKRELADKAPKVAGLDPSSHAPVYMAETGAHFTMDEAGNKKPYAMGGQLLPVTKQEKAQVNVTTNVGQKTYEKLGEEMSKDLVSEQKDVRGAVSAMNNVKEAEKLLNAGVITGTGAEFMVSMGNLLSSRLGVKFSQDPVANTQAYAATMGNQVGQIIKQFGSGTGLSDADREYAEKIVGGKITLNEQAIRKLLAINKKAYTNVIKTYNKKADQAMSKPGAESLPYDLRIDYKFDDEPAAAIKTADDYLKKLKGK